MFGNDLFLFTVRDKFREDRAVEYAWYVVLLDLIFKGPQYIPYRRQVAFHACLGIHIEGAQIKKERPAVFSGKNVFFSYVSMVSLVLMKIGNDGIEHIKEFFFIFMAYGIPTG